MMMDSIFLHLFYAIHAGSVDQKFMDMRILALGSFIALRLRTYSFFKFKSSEPGFSYCHTLHKKVENCFADEL